jgi:hypothetical protein
VSLLPLFHEPRLGERSLAYAERFSPNGRGRARRFAQRTVVGARYKLLQTQRPGMDPSPERELYDLVSDPDEHDNLLDEPMTPEVRAVYRQLVTELERLSEAGQRAR